MVWTHVAIPNLVLFFAITGIGVCWFRPLSQRQANLKGSYQRRSRMMSCISEIYKPLILSSTLSMRKTRQLGKQ